MYCIRGKSYRQKTVMEETRERSNKNQYTDPAFEEWKILSG